MLTKRDFKELVEIIAGFERLVASLTDDEIIRLIKIRLIYGSNYNEFLSFIKNNELEDDTLSKFSLIYRNIFRCLELGYLEVLRAFEIDLARAAVRLNILKNSNKGSELNQEDYFNMLTMNKSQFENIMKEKIDTAQRDVNNNGETIYY